MIRGHQNIIYVEEHAVKGHFLSYIEVSPEDKFHCIANLKELVYC